MIIKRLTMHNFGVYASTNTFEFSGEKPIVLIGGLNGRGKTTFLEAVLLALYGANSFAYQESSFKSYGQYLRSFVNMSDGSKETYIELEFELNNEGHDIYVIHREWDANNRVRTSEKIAVSKNGCSNDFLTQNWTMYIENILPSALSNFFFFDGEKIAELAVDSTNAQLKESIRAMLGISILDTLGSDLKRNIRKLQKKVESSYDISEVDRLRNVKDRAEMELNNINEEIAEKELLVSEYRERLEKKRLKYSSQGGDVIGKRDGLLAKKTNLIVQMQQLQDNIQQVASGALPLTLVSDLLYHIKEQGIKEKQVEIQEQAKNYVNEIFNMYARKSGDIQGASEFVEFLKKEANKAGSEIIYGLSDRGLLLVNQFAEETKECVLDSTKDFLKKQRIIKAQIDEIDNYLSIDINEDTLNKLYKQIRTLEQQIVDIEATLSTLKQKRSSANGEFLKASSEFNKKVAFMLERMETDDDNKRATKYYEMALRVLEKFSVKIQERKTDVLGATITSCYKNLANKKNLIEQIVMDPISLDLKYLSKEGNVVEKSALSAGEKQLMVISILWALAICSKKKLPVIIDTPLSRLDSNHRKALIKKYFPFASEQTIILSTDSEIDQNYYQLMKDNIGDEFMLQYDDESRSTTIKKGYFMGEWK